MKTLKSIVVLIDADNTQLNKMEAVLQEISSHGRIVVKRAYGNFTKEVLKKWEDELNRLAIKPVLQFDYVKGKNATDMALVIDAMDLLYKEKYDAFFIVSSDSDFNPLATRLRDSCVTVFGVGNQNASDSFKNACDEFILLENLDLPDESTKTEPKKDEVKATNSSEESKAEPVKLNSKKELHRLLSNAYDQCKDESGYAQLSTATNYIKRIKPDFDPRTYGCKSKKFRDLLIMFEQKYEISGEAKKGNLKYRVK